MNPSRSPGIKVVISPNMEVSLNRDTPKAPSHHPFIFMDFPWKHPATGYIPMTMETARWRWILLTWIPKYDYGNHLPHITRGEFPEGLHLAWRHAATSRGWRWGQHRKKWRFGHLEMATLDSHGGFVISKWWGYQRRCSWTTIFNTQGR